VVVIAADLRPGRGQSRDQTAVGLGVQTDDVHDAHHLDVRRQQVRRGADDVRDRERLLARQHADVDPSVLRDLGVHRLGHPLLEVGRYLSQVEVHPGGQRLHVAAADERPEVAEHHSGEHMQT
jgi:hypothetical protein